MSLLYRLRFQAAIAPLEPGRLAAKLQLDRKDFYRWLKGEHAYSSAAIEAIAGLLAKAGHMSLCDDAGLVSASWWNRLSRTRFRVGDGGREIGRMRKFVSAQLPEYQFGMTTSVAASSASRMQPLVGCAAVVVEHRLDPADTWIAIFLNKNKITW